MLFSRFHGTCTVFGEIENSLHVQPARIVGIDRFFERSARLFVMSKIVRNAHDTVVHVVDIVANEPAVQRPGQELHGTDSPGIAGIETIDIELVFSGKPEELVELLERPFRSVVLDIHGYWQRDACR